MAQFHGDDDDRTFERVEGVDHYGPIMFSPAFFGSGVIAAMWMGVIIYYPVVWAIGTSAAIAMLSGYGTAKAILNVRSTRIALALAPFIGLLWIGFFWALFVLF